MLFLWVVNTEHNQNVICSQPARFFQTCKCYQKRCLCLRSNMTKRGKGLQKPQCSVCGFRSHWIETCSHPLAEKMRCLIAENRKLKGAKQQKSAEGKQNRPRKNKQFKKAARKRHTGTDADQTSPQRRTKDVVDPHKTSSSKFRG